MARRALTLAALLASASPARADVLYDTLWITDQLAYEDGTENVYGGFGAWNWVEDVRLADDFVIDSARYPKGFRIEAITTDSATALGNPPAEGVIVRLLGDQGGHPGGPLHEVLIAPEFVSSTPFHDVVFGLHGQRLTIDTTHAELVLAPGTYWLNAQPYDSTRAGDAFWQLRDLDAVIGADTHFMNVQFGEFWGELGDDWGRGAGIAAMRIEGVAVPAPAALALLALVGVGRKPRKSQAGPTARRTMTIATLPASASAARAEFRGLEPQP